jgi:hypothetical protein
MCSQPPKDVDDRWILNEIKESLPLIDPTTHALTFTGGETLSDWEDFIAVLKDCRDRLPTTAIQVLTNGRAFANSEIVDAWKDIGHPNLMAAIPVYASVDHVHDHVVQAKGAFDETVLGILKLKDRGQRVEIRVVLHALTAPVIEETARWIARNLSFVDHVALMGLENTGFAIANDAMLWMDPVTLFEKCDLSRVDGDDTNGPPHESTVAFLRELHENATARRDELYEMNGDELRALYEAALRCEEISREAEAEEADKWAPFNQPVAKDISSKWRKRPHWTVHQAVSLALSREPSRILREELGRIPWRKSPFAKSFFEVEASVLLAIKSGQLSDPIDSAKFVVWLQSCELPFPSEAIPTGFEDLAKKITVLEAENAELKKNLEKEKAEGGKFDLRERKSLLKLLVALAVHHYDYQPQKGKNEATQKIYNTAIRYVKDPLDTESIILKLREGDQFLRQAEKSVPAKTTKR